jgi:hypothetical protein
VSIVKNSNVSLTTVGPKPIKFFMVQEHELTSIQTHLSEEQLWCSVCTFSFGLAIPTYFSLSTFDGRTLLMATAVTYASAVFAVIGGWQWRKHHVKCRKFIDDIRAHRPPDTTV